MKKIYEKWSKTTTMGRMMVVTVKERMMRMPKKRGWGKATTRQNLTRSSAD